MKISFLKKLALIFSGVVIVSYTVVRACADGWFDYNYDSNFTPEVFVDKSYAPLFFAQSELFYRNAFDDDHNGRFNESITKDWSEYLKGLLTHEQVAFLLVNDSSDSAIENLYQALQKKAKALAPFQAIPLTNEKVKGFVNFLHHAKAIEESSVTVTDVWNYDASAEKIFVPAVTINAVKKLYDESKDSFLKNRFWFQTVKAYFYSAQQVNAIAFFDKTKALQPKNDLYYRALSYVAGVYYRQKNFAQANYLYSIVFDEFVPMRHIAAYNFHPQEDADFKSSLALAQNVKEKSALWALFGYYGDEVAAIREIYNIDPKNEHLSYLLTRLVNKLEVSSNNQSFASPADYKRMMREQLKPDAMQLVESIAQAGNVAEPQLWLVVNGYLQTFAGKYQQATKAFDKAEAIAKGNVETIRQIRLLRLVNTICSLSKIDAQTEQKLLPEFEWVQNNCEATDENFRCSHVIDWGKTYISQLYAQGNNRVMAEVFDHSNSYYRNIGQLEAMKSFLQQSTHTPWQQLALKSYPITLSDIFEYQGVMSAFDGKLDAAIAYMEKSDNKNEELLGNPFNGKIKDCHDCDHAAPQKIKYTKISLLTKMKEMQANVDSGNDVYNNSMLLANAYYNMTYHGNARVFYYGDIMNQTGNDIDPFYHPQLLSCARARSYYEKAFEAAANAEQKAKCVYMMAKCERNEYYSKTIYAGNDGFDDGFVSWESFKKLKDEYAATRYYQDVIKECGYFKTYVQEDR